jgi:trans-2,3-dihydro-3-hydroxyanthranilate isomerase
MAFAGHPTIGTSFVLLEEGIVPRHTERFLLDEPIGPVAVRVDPGERAMIWLRTPPITEGPTFDRVICAEALGLPTSDLLPASPQLLSAGNPTLFIALRDKATVDRSWLDSHGCRLLKAGSSDPFCVFVFTPTPEGAYSRMFAPEYGVVEDPATGSSTGPLAAFMLRHHLISNAAGTTFVSEQGTKMKRRSLLHVRVLGENGRDGIEVGGRVTPVAEATMRL